MKTKHPMQPVVMSDFGVARFKENRIVSHLLDVASRRGGCGMNELALMGFSDEDRMQFAQLIGYSVSGYGDLGYASKKSVAKANRRVEKLVRSMESEQ